MANSSTRRNTKSDIASGKKVCIDSDSSGDEVEHEEKTVSVPSIRAAIQMIDELTLFAHELDTTLNSICRLLQEKRLLCLKQKKH